LNKWWVLRDLEMVMCSRPTLLLLESNTTGTGRLFVETASTLGVLPVVICKNPSQYPYLAEDKVEVIVADTFDYDVLESTVDDRFSKTGVVGIFTSSEFWAESAAKLARTFGLSGANPEAVALCRSKSKQREQFLASGLRVPRFWRVDSVEGSEDVLATASLPLVVKTTRASGSVGVRLCRSANDVLKHVTRLLERCTDERGFPVPREALIEEYLEGPEYSAEMFGLALVGITRKHLSPEPFFVETGHDYPARIPDDLAQAVRDEAMLSLETVGLTWGPSHVEMRVTRSGPVVVEINPRLAGGFIPELVRRSSGIDLIRSTLLAVMGRSPELAPSVDNYGSIRFVTSAKEGIFMGLRGVEQARSVPSVVDISVYRTKGERIFNRGDFRDRLGHIIAIHSSSETASCAASRALELVTVETVSE
jgi:S-sulfo-L-cysteine synthase (3-phospho-L-serine-dependent)